MLWKQINPLSARTIRMGGGAAGHRNIDPVHMVPAEREKGSKIERDKQTLRPKQIGHLCLKYKNKYIENN